MTSSNVFRLPSIPSLSSDDCRLLVESVADYAIFMLDTAGHVATWNLGAERIKGYAAGEIIGEHFSKFYTEEDRAAGKPERLLKAAEADGRVEDDGFRVRKDGSRFWANVVITALRDERGALRGYGKVTRDLTARKLQAEALHRAEQRFHHLVDAISDYAIFMLDQTGHVATWNAGARRMKGYAPEAIIGAHFSVFYTPEERASGKPARVLERVERDGRYQEQAFRVRKDGSRFWANVVITALRDETGALLGFAKVTQDLTERRRAEEELRRSEERFRLLVENVSEYAIYMLDVDGRVVTWNLGAERQQGYSAAEVIGQSFERFFPEEDLVAGKAARALAAAREQGRFEDEGYRVRSDGTRFWANTVLTALHDGRGELIGFAKITRDLTARRQAEEQSRLLLREQTARETAEQAEARLRDALAENAELCRAARQAATSAERAAAAAEQASRAKDEFLSIVSHELRTPLNAIMGWAKLLVTREFDEAKRKSALETIERNSVAMAQLITDMLDMSRVISGRLSLELEQVELGRVVAAALDVIRPAASVKGVELVTLVETPSPTVMGDAARLQQVVWNLLSNAVKFSAKGGRVETSVRRAESCVEIAVSDRGKGIGAEFLPWVFDPFRQEDAGPARMKGGLGLGLAITRHLVELHGGSITAASEGTGSGATFTVRLPIAAVARAPEPPGEPRAATRAAPGQRALDGLEQLRGLRVLVVDDESDSRRLVATVLEQYGCAVATAASVRAALALLAERRVDVLVSDIGMPGEDGYDLIRKVRELPSASGGDVPALALTAYTRPEDRERTLHAGYAVHLAKPVEAAELLASVAELGRSSPPRSR